jgi:hypothetical protein
MEMSLPLWLRLYRRFGTGDLNIQVHVASEPSPKWGPKAG